MARPIFDIVNKPSISPKLMSSGYIDNGTSPKQEKDAPTLYLENNIKRNRSPFEKTMGYLTCDVSSLV